MSKFLSVRSLASRGNNEQFGCTANDNFIGALELISEFDLFLAQHIDKYGCEGKKNSVLFKLNYL